MTGLWSRTCCRGCWTSFHTCTCRQQRCTTCGTEARCSGTTCHGSALPPGDGKPRHRNRFAAVTATVYRTSSSSTWTSQQTLSKRNSKRFITPTATRRSMWPPRLRFVIPMTDTWRVKRCIVIIIITRQHANSLVFWEERSPHPQAMTGKELFCSKEFRC